MSAWITPHEGPPPRREDLERWFARQGLSPSWWSNAAGQTYAGHQHGYHKILFCVEGSIVFRTGDTDDDALHLTAGDRLDVEPGTEHTAVVGDAGVTCVEAPRDR